jgi:uncharacterized HAD superfamily protein
MAEPAAPDDDDDDALAPGGSAKKYSDFMLAEYGNISQAHFNTNTAISAFFKNYLAIVGLPLPVIGFLLTYLGRSGIPTSSPGGGTGSAPSAIISFGQFSYLFIVVSWLIGLVGFCVMIYIVNLRLDAILYARAVNGIRKYFFQKSGQSLDQEAAVRVLPRSTSLPPYYEKLYFLPVIFVFALLDAFYPTAGFLFYFDQVQIPIYSWQFAIGVSVAILFGFAHWPVYAYLARHRQAIYLKRPAIGVDIDGVLGAHREHFCKMLHELRGKGIDPDKITVIPVHQCNDLGVTVTTADEQAVFNHPDYWQKMPVMAGAAEALGRIQAVLGFAVYIVTHRPWPNTSTFPDANASDYREMWKRVTWRWHRQGRAINLITQQWLDQARLPSTSLTVETSTVHDSRRRTYTNDRFALAMREQLRFFVEDNPDNARRLANICDVVFLMSQPYNRSPIDPLPNNVKRVESWHEIYLLLREMQ